ncbi:MAG: hypothetical protein IT577_21525 [Verrucomicrobiae bacterium]|nr:hypothetical protein [Verrucomicrobiae bacterium]
MRRAVGRLLWVAIFVLTCVGAHEAQAARRGRRHHRPDVFQTYDENKNRILDPAERNKIKRDFNEDERLEQFDRDGDRKLSDEEIDAIRPQGGKQKAKGGGKK